MRSLWWVGGLGVIIESNLNRVRLSCCWVGVGLGCDNILGNLLLSPKYKDAFVDLAITGLMEVTQPPVLKI